MPCVFSLKYFFLYFLFLFSGTVVAENCPDAIRLLEKALQESSVEKEQELYREAITLCPNQLEAHYNLGVVLLEKKDFDQALEYFQRANSIKNDDRDVQLALVSTLFSAGKIKEAEALIQSALAESSLEKKHTTLFKELYAKLHFRNGDIEKAKSFLEEILSENKENPEISLNYGKILLAEKKYEEASLWYEKYLQKKEGSEDVCKEYALSLAYSGVKNAPDCLQGRNSEQMRILYAYFLEKQGNFQEALSEYAELHSLYPKNKVIKNNYQYLLLKVGDFEGDFLKGASGGDPGYEARFLWYNDEKKKAIRVLEKALERDPMNKNLHQDLAAMASRVGNSSLSKRHLKRILDLKKDSEKQG